MTAATDARPGIPAARQALQRVTERATRRPTCLPSWPILLIAGAPKAGKTWSCAEASGSELVGRTLWVPIGESDPDEYGAVPGADFEIVSHDGSYRDIRSAIEWAVAQPPVDGKPNLIVVDSVTRLWDLLCDMAQHEATARAQRKARNARNALPADEEVPISMDLWNTAKDRWGYIIEILRDHQGPVILTALLEEVTVMQNGQPTAQKTLKIQAEKKLSGVVQAIVQMPERGQAWLCGVTSVKVPFPERTQIQGPFGADKLWRDLGLAGDVGVRQHTAMDPAEDGRAARVALINEVAMAADRAGVTREDVAKEWASTHSGEHIKNATDIGGLELLRDDLAAKAATATTAQNGSPA